MGGCRKPGPSCSTTSTPADDGTTSRQTTPPPKPVGTFPFVLRSESGDKNSADFNRSFGSIVNPYLGDQITPREAFFEAYLLDEARGTLSSVWLVPKDGQNFAAFATTFELECIEIAGAAERRFAVTPVVKKTSVSSKGSFGGLDLRFLVIGYIAKLAGSQLYLPRGITLIDDLPSLLKHGIPFFIGYGPILWAGDKGGEPLLWQRAGISEVIYTLLARIDGGVVVFLKSEASGFVESEFGPILFLGSILAPLGTGALRTIVTSVFRRGETAAANLALDGMTNDLAQNIEQDVREVAKDLLAKQPPGRAIVNLGGTGEVAGAINLNPLLDQQVSGVPNLVRGSAEQVGDIFPASSVNSVVSNDIVNGQINWPAAAKGMQKILRPGGTISIAPYAGQLEEQLAAIKAALEAAGFRQIKIISQRLITAVK
jgi:hypothetical protein